MSVYFFFVRVLAHLHSFAARMQFTQFLVKVVNLTMHIFGFAKKDQNERDFLPGVSLYDTSIEERCKKFVVILSSNFDDSEKARYELQVALGLSAGTRDRHVIPVVIEEASRYTIPRTLFHITCLYYLRLEEKHFWKILHTMEYLFKLVLSSQTIFGGIQFLSISISLGAVIGTIQAYHANDRLTFNCSPKPSDFTKQLCYDKYTSTVSPRLIPRNFAIITYAGVLAGWICFMLYAAGTLRQISREQATTATAQRLQAEQNHRRHRSKFLKVYVLHVVVRLLFLGVMIGLFCSYQTLDLPSVFKCDPLVPQTNTTSTPVTETVLQCNDLHYKEKSNLNIAIIVIESSILMLGILEVIHLSLTRKTFLKKFLRNMEFNMENVPLVSERDVERDVKPAEVDASSQNRSPATNENVEEEQSLAYSNAEQRQAVSNESLDHLAGVLKGNSRKKMNN
ncbi:Myeloid differentiation primary response protein MyD88 [Desmophyllum pertusum]|uniref:Myeloid differentiation primary response protein MyD88 n=1 Tax=Desmophyllum pertusum TaxID=174260 RepID=A0A9W9Y920_9CNID|nr:Myeloid differentiation primary response protein MyD88 [Desmophyllum pertusum]